MPAIIKSAALSGIEAVPIDIEVEVLGGLPSFTVVGLGDTAVKESKERLTAALSNLNFDPPRKKTIVSMAPASLKKEGSMYDMPITIGFLSASGQTALRQETLNNAWFIGELGLDGTIRPVRGVMPMTLAAIKRGIREIFIPSQNQNEVISLASEISIIPVKTLGQVISHLMSIKNKAEKIRPLVKKNMAERAPEPDIDFSDIKGQEQAKRALLIAASASHNALFVGSPGSGKTLLARAMGGIMPPLSQEESYEVTSLYSVAGLLNENAGVITTRPFRSPHHGASAVALVGGGTHPKPGEVSLAHNGVLFLDELPEFSRHVLDQLRQPLEDGHITVSRSSHTVSFPARSVLVGAMNPCKCGYLGHSKQDCRCSPGDVVRYQRRVSGPLLDRFDLHLMINDISMEELLSEKPSGLSSKELSEIASAARKKQMQRQNKTNSALTAKEIKIYCEINEPSKKLLKKAESRFHLSSRGVHRLLKVARTIADLSDKENIEAIHIAEALQYREQLQAALPDFA